MAGVVVAEAVDHLTDLRGPGGVALISLEKLLQRAATDGEPAEGVEIFGRRNGHAATGVGAGGERDAAEDAGPACPLLKRARR